MNRVSAISPSKLYKKYLGDWVINPYLGCRHGCAHCYCPGMPGVRCHNGGRSSKEWGNYVEPAVGLIEALEKELRTFTPAKARTSASGDGWVLMSYLTDPYTPPEGEMKLTRACLERLFAAGHKVRVQTRSALIKRDFDLFKAHPGQVIIGTSIPHLDEGLSRLLEPRASGISSRLNTFAEAAAQGIPTFVAIAPFYPFHDEQMLDEVVAKARETFAPLEIFCEVLNPKGDCLERVAEALSRAIDPNHQALEQVIRDYQPERWAQFTYRVLAHGAATVERFVPWPDTGRAWERFLEPGQAAFLSRFLPR